MIERNEQASRVSDSLSEHARIARETHDTLAQALAGVVMQLETARLLPSKEKAEHHLDRAGIRGMRERAQEINAQFNIQSRAHAGTEIEIVLPLA